MKDAQGFANDAAYLDAAANWLRARSARISAERELTDATRRFEEGEEERPRSQPARQVRCKVMGLREAEELTPFAVTTRYPGEDEEVSEEEARRAIALAERVQRVLAERLSAYLTQADAAAH